MNMKTHNSIIIFIISYLFCTSLYAVQGSGHDLVDEEWSTEKGKVYSLDELSDMPVLLPLILRNHDVLKLTNRQVMTINNWRQKHYVNLMVVMNEIIRNQTNYKKAALDLKTPDSKLYDMQNTILNLQEKLYNIKLTYRKMMAYEFTQEQWNNLAFILTDHPKIAGLIQH